MSAGRPLSEVPELDGYGEGITGVTLTGRKHMPRIVLRAVYREFGIVKGIAFLLASLARSVLVKRRNPEGMALAADYSSEFAADFPMIVGMYETHSNWADETTAYEFLRDIIQTSATYQMYDLYPVEELQTFDDTFEAFKRYNYGIFADDDNYPMTGFIDEPNHCQIDVGSCANVEIARAFGYPELAKLGCDHDLAGYPLIEDEVDAVFRRSQTIAKGADSCDFQFYRKGTEPEATFENK